MIGSDVALGGTTAGSVTTDRFRAQDMRFRPGLRLGAHYHGEAIFTVPLHGRLELVSNRRRFVCRPGTVFTVPPGETHSSAFGADGARSLVIAPLDLDTDPAACAVFRTARVVDSLPIVRLARAIADETRQGDTLTSLAVDGMVLQIIALTLRTDLHLRLGRRPAWLARVVDIIHDAGGRRLMLAEVATAVNTSPVYLARAFRASYGMSIACFARRVRIDRAAERLGATDDAIEDIARESGFSDQSHFTRVFRTTVGMTPAQYRRAADRSVRRLVP